MVKLRSKRVYTKKLILVSLLALLCNLGVAGTTAAWFVANRRVFVDVNEIGLTDGSFIDKENVQIFPYYHDSDGNLINTASVNNSDTYAFDVTPSTGVPQLGEYDLMESPIGNAILIKVPLKQDSSVTSFEVKGYCNVDFFEGASGQQLEYEGNSLSSIVDFYTFVGDTYCDTSISNDYYVFDINNATTKTCFVHEGEIVSPIAMSPSAALVTYVYIIIDYNVELLNEVYSNNIGNEVTNGDQSVLFDFDFVISFKETVS